MTAPDPGLTELIAAHWRSLDLLKMKYTCSCGDWEFRDDDRERACASWCEHLALVVEQHTNGRATELEWDALVAAIPDGWELRESAQLEEVSRVRQRDLEASQATTTRWRARAEKAEATIDRVWAIIPRVIQGVGRNATYMDVGRASGKEQVWKQLRAALEGES